MMSLFGTFIGSGPFSFFLPIEAAKRRCVTLVTSQMTRYANVGIKRKYLQAGFDDAGEENIAEGKEEKLQSTSTEKSALNPSKKKVKASKKFSEEATGSKDEERNEGSAEGDPSSSKDGEDLKQVSNRKLYKIRRAKGECLNLFSLN